MRQVARGNVTTLQSVGQIVNALCDASSQVTEEIGDAYTFTLPADFVPVRTLDLTKTLTVNEVAAVLVTFLQDLQNRGASRRSASV